MILDYNASLIMEWMSLHQVVCSAWQMLTALRVAPVYRPRATPQARTARCSAWS